MATKKSIQKKISPKKNAVSPFDFTTDDIALNKLLLDPNNYRFLDHKNFKKKVVNRFHEEKVQIATLENLERHYQLDELKDSILVNGYVPMERIIVTPYKDKPGLYLVVEGNRRVAALKSLLKEANEGVIELAPTQVTTLSSVPCAVLKSIGKSLKHAERVIMGIRHIAGPKEWGAYQQALLVSELKDEEQLEFKEIGEMLGTSAVEAARRYRAVIALKFMEDDELFGSKAESSFYRLFHELVSTPEVREYFGWDHVGLTFSDVEQAREFFQLITSHANHEPKLATYNDVRRLKQLIGNTLAVDSLLDPDQTLIQAIRIAEEGKSTASPSSILQTVVGLLTRIGVSQAKSLTAADISKVDEIMSTLDGFKSLVKSKKK